MFFGPGFILAARWRVGRREGKMGPFSAYKRGVNKRNQSYFVSLVPWQLLALKHPVVICQCRYLCAQACPYRLKEFCNPN